MTRNNRIRYIQEHANERGFALTMSDDNVTDERLDRAINAIHEYAEALVALIKISDHQISDEQISEDLWTEIMIDEADRTYWRYPNGARLRATQGMDGHMLTVMVDGAIVGQCCDGVKGRAGCRALMDELNASDMKCDAAKHIFMETQ